MLHLLAMTTRQRQRRRKVLILTLMTFAALC